MWSRSSEEAGYGGRRRNKKRIADEREETRSYFLPFLLHTESV
jgi:hypothetical protein